MDAVACRKKLDGRRMQVTGNRPLSKEDLWSIRSVLAVEAFIDMSIEPGKAFTWRYDYTYYSLNQASKGTPASPNPRLGPRR